MKIGETAPNFTLNSFEGQPYTLTDMRGKVVLVNFWASWCKPCEQEAPFLEEAWSLYKDRDDVVFLGVDYTDTPTAAAAYLEKFHVSYPNGPDMGTKISHDYRITGVPETYIIDKTGKLAYSKFSPFLSTSEIQQAIDPLLSH
jgi:cytochrome c biogenesis protein CcmG/thiol:disulfide interchange protein DsbE